MPLKNILPFENYVLTTNLSVEEVLKRMADNIQPKEGFKFFAGFNRNYAKPYTGYIIGRTFTMNRNINYRNSFLPVITGQIVIVSGKTAVKIKMQLGTVVLIFMSFWLGVIGLVCIGILVAGFSEHGQVFSNEFSPAFLIPFGMLVFGCLLTHFGFKGESKKSKAFLANLLESVEE
ncbi:MAG: hypothetical protein QM802_22355 [Agriterribacter sp.]